MNDMKYYLELMELERIFEFNGYDKKMILNVEMQDNAQTIEEFVNNLEEERSCWGE